jgi:hypothetical protein
MDGAWSPNWMEQLFRQRSSARFILPLVLFCSVLFCSVLFCSVLFCSCSGGWLTLRWTVLRLAAVMMLMLYGCYYVRD